MNNDYRFAMLAVGPLNIPRLRIIKKEVDREITKKIIVMVDAMTFYEEFVDDFEIVLIDDLRKNYQHSFWFERLPEVKTLEDSRRHFAGNTDTEDSFWVQNWTRMYGSGEKGPPPSSPHTLPLPLYRYVIPYLAEQNITNFCITGTDAMFHHDPEHMNNAWENVPVGTLFYPRGPYIAWWDDDEARENLMNELNRFTSKYFSEEFPNLPTTFPLGEAQIRGGKFKSVQDMMLYFEVWDQYMRWVYEIPSGSPELLGQMANRNIVWDDNWGSYLTHLFEINKGYGWRNDFDEATLHCFRYIDKLFYIPWQNTPEEFARTCHPYTQEGTVPWDFSDYENYSNFLKNNEHNINLMAAHAAPWYAGHDIFEWFLDTDIGVIFRYAKNK